MFFRFDFFFFILFSARLFAIAEKERGASKHSASREPFSAASRFYIPVFLRWGRGPRREIWASLGEEGDGLLRLFGDVLQSCFKNWPSGSGMQANPCLPRARASDRVRVCVCVCGCVPLCMRIMSLRFSSSALRVRRVAAKTTGPSSASAFPERLFYFVTSSALLSEMFVCVYLRTVRRSILL